MRHVRQISAIEGQRKAAAEFNPFFAADDVAREIPQGDSLVEVACSIFALLAFFAALGLWIVGAL